MINKLQNGAIPLMKKLQQLHCDLLKTDHVVEAFARTTLKLSTKPKTKNSENKKNPKYTFARNLILNIRRNFFDDDVIIHSVTSLNVKH